MISCGDYYHDYCGCGEMVEEELKERIAELEALLQLKQAELDAIALDAPPQDVTARIATLEAERDDAIVANAENVRFHTDRIATLEALLRDGTALLRECREQRSMVSLREVKMDGSSLGQRIDTHAYYTDVALGEKPTQCICKRFSDTGGYRIADLCCPVHGVDGTDPGDGSWEKP